MNSNPVIFPATAVERPKMCQTCNIKCYTMYNLRIKTTVVIVQTGLIFFVVVRDIKSETLVFTRAEMIPTTLK